MFSHCAVLECYNLFSGGKSIIICYFLENNDACNDDFISNLLMFELVGNAYKYLL